MLCIFFEETVNRLITVEYQLDLADNLTLRVVLFNFQLDGAPPHYYLLQRVGPYHSIFYQYDGAPLPVMDLELGLTGYSPEHRIGRGSKFWRLKKY